jgi:hypothetical protein
MPVVRRRAESEREGFAMNGIPVLSLGIMLVLSASLGAEDSPRFVRKSAFPGTAMVVVAVEGDFEPRSNGSYSLRVYAGTDPRFPHDDFVAGTVRPRDGTVEDVRFSDLDRDGSPDIIVVMRSAGTGSYLSADAFQLQGTGLTLLESVSGLARDADPIRALETKLTSRAEPRAAPNAGKPRR